MKGKEDLAATGEVEFVSNGSSSASSECQFYLLRLLGAVPWILGFKHFLVYTVPL